MEFEQPWLFVTVTEIVRVFPVPAVNTIALVFTADVIVPPVMFQLYVAPVPAFGTDALLPVEEAQTVDDEVIAEDGNDCTVTTLELLLEQPWLFVTVTETVSELPVPAV